MRKNVEDEELQKIVRILTKSVSLKLNNLWPKKFGYDLGTKAVEFVEGGKCIKGAQPFVESLRDELSGIKHKGRSIKEVDDYEIMFGEDIRKLFKNPRAKPDGTKMFCSAFLNDARMCCFFANAIVKY